MKIKDFLKESGLDFADLVAKKDCYKALVDYATTGEFNRATKGLDHTSDIIAGNYDKATTTIKWLDRHYYGKQPTESN